MDKIRLTFSPIASWINTVSLDILSITSPVDVSTSKNDISCLSMVSRYSPRMRAACLSPVTIQHDTSACRSTVQRDSTIIIVSDIFMKNNTKTNVIFSPLICFIQEWVGRSLYGSICPYPPQLLVKKVYNESPNNLINPHTEQAMLYQKNTSN